MTKSLVFHSSVREALLKYQWPGNVRELKNRIRQAALIADNEVRVEHLFSQAGFKAAEPQVEPKNKLSDLRNQTYEEQFYNFEKSLFEQALAAHNGNKLKAATQLGMYYATFCRKLKRYTL